MATSQISADARLSAIRDAYERKDGVLVVKAGETFDTIFDRALSLSDIKPEDVTESQRTNFKNSFNVVRSEYFAATSMVRDGEKEVSGFEFLSNLNVKKQDMLKKLTSTYKDQVTSAGVLLPIPEGFVSGGHRGRKAVDAKSYFDSI